MQFSPDSMTTRGYLVAFPRGRWRCWPCQRLGPPRGIEPWRWPNKWRQRYTIWILSTYFGLSISLQNIPITQVMEMPLPVQGVVWVGWGSWHQHDLVGLMMVKSNGSKGIDLLGFIPLLPVYCAHDVFGCRFNEMVIEPWREFADVNGCWYGKKEMKRSVFILKYVWLQL